MVHSGKASLRDAGAGTAKDELSFLGMVGGTMAGEKAEDFYVGLENEEIWLKYSIHSAPAASCPHAHPALTTPLPLLWSPYLEPLISYTLVTTVWRARMTTATNINVRTTTRGGN